MKIYNIETKIYQIDSTGSKYLCQQSNVIVSAEDNYDAASMAFVKVHDNMKGGELSHSSLKSIQWSKNHTEATVDWEYGRKLSYEFNITKVIEYGV